MFVLFGLTRYNYKCKEVRLLFMQYFKQLDTDERYKTLSVSAKFLHMHLYDRRRLSQERGWTDENGSVYVYFGREEMARLLGASERTAIRVMGELTDARLVTVGCRDGGLSPRLYVKEPDEQKCEKKTEPPPEKRSLHDKNNIEAILLARMAEDY